MEISFGFKGKVGRIEDGPEGTGLMRIWDEAGERVDEELRNWVEVSSPAFSDCYYLNRVTGEELTPERTEQHFCEEPVYEAFLAKWAVRRT